LEVSEFGDELLGSLVGEGGGGGVWGKRGEEVAVGWVELEFDVCAGFVNERGWLAGRLSDYTINVFALRQVGVCLASQERVSVATNDTL